MTVELPILGALADRRRHGYDLRRVLEKMLGPSWTVSWGALYPMLRKLDERGYVTKCTATPERGLERIVYQITPAGRQRLMDLLTSSDRPGGAAGRHGFLLRVAFFHLLTPAQRLRVLDAYRHTLQAQLTELLADQERIGARASRYRRILLDHALARLNSDVAWLDSVIAMEQDATVAAGASEEYA